MIITINICVQATAKSPLRSPNKRAQNVALDQISVIRKERFVVTFQKTPQPVINFNLTLPTHNGPHSLNTEPTVISQPSDETGSKPKKIRLGSGTNSRVTLFITTAMILVTLALTAAQFIMDYRDVNTEAEKRAEAYALAMATDVRWYLDVVRQTLKRVDDQSFRIVSRGADAGTIRDTLGELPTGVVVVVYDANGKSLEFLNHESGPVDISDRTYFNKLKAGSNFEVSYLIADRVTGQLTFAVGIAMRRGGMFVGAAIAYAPMEVFKSTWLSIGGAQSNAFLVHEDGWLTARLPPVASSVYDGPLEQEFVDKHFATPSGAYTSDPSPIDGIARTIGFARVEGAPLVATIGISTADQLYDFWVTVAGTLAVLLPILGLLGLAAARNTALIRKHEETAKEIEGLLEQNQLLFLEIHHRVKNNLQSVLSLIRLHAKSENPVGEIQPRIQAMVAVHEHIYGTDSYVDVAAPDYITEMANQIIEASGQNVVLETEICDVAIPTSLVMPLGQLIAEGVINALKYGFPNGQSGVINITLSNDENNIATLEIFDNGAPMENNPNKGMGTRLMHAFAAQLGGTVETSSNASGVSVVVRFPLH
jgi:two-component sensor histidine kinase